MNTETKFLFSQNKSIFLTSGEVISFIRSNQLRGYWMIVNLFLSTYLVSFLVSHSLMQCTELHFSQPRPECNKCN